MRSGIGLQCSGKWDEMIWACFAKGQKMFGRKNAWVRQWKV